MPVPVIISLASLIFCAGAFAYFKSYINRRTSRDAVLADIREEINRLLLRLDETANRDISLIEDKEQSLKALLEETEKRLKVYSREMDRSLHSERVYRELGKMQFTLVDNGKKEEQAAEAAPVRTAASAAARAVPDEASPSAGGAPSFGGEPSIGGQIRALAASGFSSTVIASKLGISISEADLALAVLDRKPLV